MKKTLSFLPIGIFILIVTTTNIRAQEIERRVSQFASIIQRVGITDIKIDYHRPSVKGREVWGKLVPYGYNYLGYGSSKAAPWRAGANECTTISFTEDVVIEGNKLQAGKYGLFMAVFENGEVEVIFSNNSSIWGSYDYKQSEDALRVTVSSNKAPHQELLTYGFIDLDTNSVTISLNWGKKMIPVKLIMTK